MKISTLEMIHELLKKEVETRDNERKIRRKAYYEAMDYLEEIAAAVDDMKEESMAAAKKAADKAQAAYDEARRQSNDADAALREFEAQEF